uniref:Uncharacterized protein n=1 Tax=Peromyscus maniculatus bairdii TaxID=230844 RepID=A0A8C8W4T7_PERMB
MALLRLLVFCTLAACCVARSPPQTPLASFPLPRSCNDTEVRAVAGFALQSLNQDRKDGYALSLSRVHDAWEHFQASDSLWDSLWTGCRDQSGGWQLRATCPQVLSSLETQCSAIVSRWARALLLSLGTSAKSEPLCHI